MNAPTPAIAFNLTPDQFDAHVAQAFAAASATRHVRDRLVADVRNGRLDHLLLKRLPGFAAMSQASSRRAALNVIDFHFEPIVMPSMSVAQAATYFQSIEASLKFGDVSALDGPGPLWVDTVHHACIFSVMYQLAALIAQRRQTRHVVLLHQGKREEPRLGIVVNMLAQLHQVRLDMLRLEDPWPQQLAAMATPETTVFYLTDMPPEAFEGRRDNPRHMAETQLYAAPDILLRAGTVSGSGVFAKRLGARHVVLDYPRPDLIRIRPYDAARPTALCPLEDWIFWPLLGARQGDGLSRRARPRPVSPPPLPGLASTSRDPGAPETRFLYATPRPTGWFAQAGHEPIEARDG